MSSTQSQCERCRNGTFVYLADLRRYGDALYSILLSFSNRRMHWAYPVPTRVFAWNSLIWLISVYPTLFHLCHNQELALIALCPCYENKFTEKSMECHNHKPQPTPDTKRNRKKTYCSLTQYMHHSENTHTHTHTHTHTKQNKWITMMKQRRVLLANPTNTASQSQRKPLVEPRRAKP